MTARSRLSLRGAARPLLAVLGARYRTLLQYRAAAFAGFVTQLFWGAVRLMILAAFYAAASGPQPMNMTEIVAYVWLGQALLGMLPWNTDADFVRQVRDGAVAYDLLRPLDPLRLLVRAHIGVPGCGADPARHPDGAVRPAAVAGRGLRRLGVDAAAVGRGIRVFRRRSHARRPARNCSDPTRPHLAVVDDFGASGWTAS